MVGAGGFVGSALRYSTSIWVQRWATTTNLPVATLAVNVVGCLLIGIIGGVAGNRVEMSHGLWLFLVVGVLGGFTTFSAFGHEVFMLVQGGHRLHAFGHVFLHLLLGIGAAALGYAVAGRGL